MTKAAIYARVSTPDQDPEVQVRPLRDYCSSRSMEIVAEFRDHGVSGSKSQRPGLDRMLGGARRGRFDVVVVAKLDRLARSVHHLTTMAKELEALGVDLVVTDQAIDTSTPSGRLLFHTLAAIAEFERDLIRERTRAGVEAARRKGRRLGRPRALSKEQARRVRRLAGHGHSQRAIARLLGVGRSTIAREIARLGRSKPPGAKNEPVGPA